MSGRPLWVALAAWGVALLAVPRWVAQFVGGPRPPTAVVRVLGARRLLQSLVLLRWPTPGVASTAAVVDGLHAASMLAAARVWPRYRRAELASAVLAGCSATVTLLAGRSRRRQ